MQHKSMYVWGFVARFTPAGIQLVTNMILARLLTPQDFGTIGVLAIIFTFHFLRIKSMHWVSKEPEQNTMLNQLNPISKGTPYSFGPNTWPYW